jgi:hypothetical protein
MRASRAFVADHRNECHIASQREVTVLRRSYPVRKMLRHQIVPSHDRTGNNRLRHDPLQCRRRTTPVTSPCRRATFVSKLMSTIYDYTIPKTRRNRALLSRPSAMWRQDTAYLPLKECCLLMPYLRHKSLAQVPKCHLMLFRTRRVSANA